MTGIIIKPMQKLGTFVPKFYRNIFVQPVRSQSSYATERLEYTNYGIPTEVIKHIKEEKTFDLKKGEVLVKFLASPVNPADINTIQVRKRVD